MLVNLKPLRPKDAIAYFRSKGLATSFDYRDVWQDEHAKAFTVAKAMSIDILEDIRQAMDIAIADGRTFDQFKKELAPILIAKGWWGKKEMTDPLTGETKLVQLGSDRRLRTIFATNMRVSYQVGNWNRSWTSRELLPYLRFIHNDVRFPRPEHVAWDGTVLPIEDDWWKTHYPPCAWGCKCSTESLSAKMLAARGIAVTTRPAKFRAVEYVNPRTGVIEDVEQGIDPAWNYNPGLSPLRAITAQPTAPPEGTAPADPGELEAQSQAFLSRIGAKPAGQVIVPSDGWPVAVGPDMFRDVTGGLTTPRPDLLADLPLVADAIVAADSVEWLWAEGEAAEATEAAPNAGSVKPPLARLVRRYSKAIDNRQFTVDFSDGAWIYDIRALKDG